MDEDNQYFDVKNNTKNENLEHNRNKVFVSILYQIY